MRMCMSGSVLCGLNFPWLAQSPYRQYEYSFSFLLCCLVLLFCCVHSLVFASWKQRFNVTRMLKCSDHGYEDQYIYIHIDLYIIYITLPRLARLPSSVDVPIFIVHPSVTFRRNVQASLHSLSEFALWRKRGCFILWSESQNVVCEAVYVNGACLNSLLRHVCFFVVFPCWRLEVSIFVGAALISKQKLNDNYNDGNNSWNILFLSCLNSTK